MRGHDSDGLHRLRGPALQRVGRIYSEELRGLPQRQCAPGSNGFEQAGIRAGPPVHLTPPTRWVLLFSDDFHKQIEPFLDKWNYGVVSGGRTDVVKLKEIGLNISVFNMSCGYYNPHTDYEYVNIDDVVKCFNFVHDIIKNLSNKKWYHIID